MEIDELARRVLFSDRLEDKLATPQKLTDLEPGPRVVELDAPARSADLQFQARENRVSFPGPGRIRDVHDIGETLHYFANHELLAVELMALCLLKFPDAPKAFRMAIANTLTEEQEHVRLYEARMKACGISWGEVSVGDYFWRVTAPMTSPSQFVARMSLTFEQANLDYSGFYGELFRRLGDDETAGLMQRVYEDEIRHVRLGLLWFNRWRDGKQPLFDSYAAALDKPLSPVRARGIGFNREGRRVAGLPDAFIDQLAVFGHSRGRSPDVYRFDPLAEERCRPGGARETKVIRALAADLAMLPTYLASADDVVIVPEVPTIPFLGRLVDVGIPVPEYVAATRVQDLDGTGLAERRLRGYRPWAWSPAEQGWLDALGNGAFDFATGMVDLMKAFSAACGKSFGLQLRKAVAGDTTGLLVSGMADGCVAEGLEELQAAVDALAEKGNSRVMIKPVYGAAGRDNLEIDAADPLPKIRQDQGPWVVEPFWDFVVLGSTQIEVDSDGCRILGDTIMQMRGRGRYVGTIVGDLAGAMTDEVRRFVYGNRRRGLSVIHNAAQVVGEELQAAGYSGAAGIDWGIARDAVSGELRVQPVIECNPRYTMGRVALALRKRTLPGRTGLLSLISPAKALELADERMIVENRTGQPLMDQGILHLTDPSRATVTSAVWIVGRPAEECRERL